MPTYKIPGPDGVMLEGTSKLTEDSPVARSEAAVDAINRFNKQSAAHTASTASAKGGAKPKEPDFIGKMKQAIVGDMSPAERGASLQGDLREPSSTVAALKGAGEVVLPGSLEELAVQVATGGAGRAGAAVGRAVGGGVAGQLARTATGVAVPAAAGGAAGLAKGESPLPGMALGAVAGGIGEGTRLFFQGTGAGVEKFTRFMRGTETKTFNERVRAQIGPRLAHDVAADIPSLREAGIKLNNVPDMIALLDDSTGRKVVGTMFDKVEGEVAKKVGSIDLPRDVVTAAGRNDLLQAAVGRDAEMAKQVAKQLGAPVDDPRVQQALKGMGIDASGGTGPVSVSGVDAIQMAKQLRHQGLRKGEGVQGRPSRVMADDIQHRLDIGLGTDPLAQKYAQLRNDYSKFMDLRDFLVKNDPSKLFPGMVSKEGATIDLVHLGDRMMKDFADLPPSRFPNLHKTMTGGGTGERAIGGGGASPTASMGMHVPGTPIYVHPKGAKSKAPDLPAGLDVGKTLPGPITKAGNVAAGAARVGTVGIVPSLNE